MQRRNSHRTSSHSINNPPLIDGNNKLTNHSCTYRYTAELTMRGTGQGQGGLMQGQGQLQLIKTDDFKNLVTLALVLRAGTDMAVKKHLASQLIAFKSLSSSLRVQLDESQASLSKRAEVCYYLYTYALYTYFAFHVPLNNQCCR